ncbi:twin-arginine translocase TatA/TatE family subunit [Schaalia suimastitidis]|uniref:twin-arginine translocase TatA/TatE family subunit n=1 Tax=Schaalia suimastitidis TaxID=121163 RepID=UPI000478C95F|nr:twin-arginine translocase TatA/TatE family subunit [Schaalia suimastitidis]
MRPHHYLILALIALLLFGAQRLPDFARNLGQSLKILKKELHEPGTQETTQAATSENAAATPVTSQSATVTPTAPEPAASSSPTNTAS